MVTRPISDADAEELRKLREGARRQASYLFREDGRAIITGTNVFAIREYRKAQARLESLVARIAVILAKYKG